MILLIIEFLRCGLSHCDIIASSPFTFHHLNCHHINWHTFTRSSSQNRVYLSFAAVLHGYLIEDGMANYIICLAHRVLDLHHIFGHLNGDLAL